MLITNLTFCDMLISFPLFFTQRKNFASDDQILLFSFHVCCVYFGAAGDICCLQSRFLTWPPHNVQSYPLRLCPLPSHLLYILCLVWARGGTWAKCAGGKMETSWFLSLDSDQLFSHISFIRHYYLCKEAGTVKSILTPVQLIYTFAFLQTAPLGSAEMIQGCRAFVKAQQNIVSQDWDDSYGWARVSSPEAWRRGNDCDSVFPQ